MQFNLHELIKLIPNLNQTLLYNIKYTLTTFITEMFTEFTKTTSF